MRKYVYLFSGMLVLATAARATAKEEATAPLSYTVPPFENYQVILDKLPFGAGPDGTANTPESIAAAQAAAMTEQQINAEKQNIAKNVKLTCINATPNGHLAIGFTDVDGKNESNYYLLTGESKDGWTVLSADYVQEIATLKKDDITLSLKLGKGLVDTPSNAVTEAVAAATAINSGSPTPPPLATERHLPPGLRAGGLPPGLSLARPPEGGGLSYRDRRRDQVLRDAAANREQEQKRQEELRSAVKAAAAEVLAAEKQRQAEEAQQQEPSPDDPPPPEQ